MISTGLSSDHGPELRRRRALRVWPLLVAALLALGETILRNALAHYTDIRVSFVFLYPVSVLAGIWLGAAPAMVVVTLGLISLSINNTGASNTTIFITAMVPYVFTLTAFSWTLDRRDRAQLAALREAGLRLQAQAEALAAEKERDAVSKLLGVHEATSRALATALPVGIWVSHDAQARRVTGNAEALHMLRLDTSDTSAAVGRGGPDEPFEICRAGAPVSTASLPMVRASRGEEVRGDDLEVKFKDGSTSVLRVSAIPLHDEQANAAGAVGVVVDITERRRAEEAIKESEDRFRVMGDHAPVLLWLSDTTKKCIWFNRAWLDFVGRAMQQEQGYGWTEGIHPDDRRRCVEFYESHFERREAFRMKYRLRRHDGEYRWLLDHGVPLRQGDDFIGYIGSCVDITDLELSRRGIETYVKELERINRELEDFAHIAAHDLKEPLRGVRLIASFLEEDFASTLGPEGAARIKTLQELCERSQLLLDSLMEVAQVSRAEPSLEDCRVGDLVGEAIHMLSARIRESGAGVTVAADAGDVTLLCDRRRTVQALMNLISNGIKYNESPIKRIEIGITRQADAPVSLWVRDNGIGIAPDRAAGLFQLFRRLHARDAYGGGAGAGLAIVKRIAERHGGRVWVESEPGKGSTFHMTLHAAPTVPERVG